MASGKWSVREGTRATDGVLRLERLERVAALAGAPAPLLPFAAPDERRRLRVPPTDGGREPVHDLLCARGVLPLERAADEDALHGFGHVQPGAPQGREERQDTVGETPAQPLRRVVARQVVEYEQHAQRRQVPQQGRFGHQPFPPLLPRGVGAADGGFLRRQVGQACDDGGQFGFEPRVQDLVRRVGDGQGPYLTGRRPEQGEQLGGAAADVLVGLPRRLALRLPGRTGLWESLVGTGLILAPHLQAQRLPGAVRPLD